MRAVSTDGIDRWVDRTLSGERKSLTSIPANVLEDDVVAQLLNENDDEPSGEADRSTSRSHSRMSINEKLLNAALENSSTQQGSMSKIFYNLLGLQWHDKVFSKQEPLGPQMYKFHNIGLYTHYAGVGLSGAIAGLCSNFCFYYYGGNNNVCANAQSLVFVAWGFKIFYAMLTDSYRPFGSRRKVYMIVGWIGVLFCTLLLAMIGDTCSVEAWLGISVATQAFLMLADVPADGYSG